MIVFFSAVNTGYKSFSLMGEFSFQACLWDITQPLRSLKRRILLSDLGF